MIALEAHICDTEDLKNVLELVPNYAARMQRPRFRRMLGRLRGTADFKEDQNQDGQDDADDDDDDDAQTQPQHTRRKHLRGCCSSPFVDPLLRSDLKISKNQAIQSSFSVYCAQDGWTRGAWEKSGSKDDGNLKGFALIKKMEIKPHVNPIRSISGSQSGFLSASTRKNAEKAMSNASHAISEMGSLRHKKIELRQQKELQQQQAFSPIRSRLG